MRLVPVSLAVTIGACDGSPPPEPQAAASAPSAAPVGPAEVDELVATEQIPATDEADPVVASPTRWTPADPLPGGLASPPEGFVSLHEAVPRVILDIRYAGEDNFTGAALPGYGAPGAWLHVEAAAALARVAERIAPEGLGLLVYDAYRPARASKAMVEWAERTDNTWTLEQGYVAARSGHNHGHTVDLTLYEFESGVELDMGTPWDTFSSESHIVWGEGEVRANRDRLQAAMTAEGWKPYSKEWWHFRLPVEGTVPLDLQYEVE